MVAPRRGGCQLIFANFNGPCSAYYPAANAALMKPYLPGISPEIQHIDMTDSEHGWAVAGSGLEDDHLLRTTDGGVTWADITPPEFAASNEAARKQITGAYHADGSAQVAFYYSETGHCAAGGQPVDDQRLGRYLAERWRAHVR